MAKTKFSSEFPVTEQELRTLVHELQVHQIELELQTEELLQAQLTAQAAQERYFRLYNSAPVGYFSLDPKAIILDVNLTGAAMLNHERRFLKGRPLAPKLPAESRVDFFVFLNRLFASKTPQSEQFTLPHKESGVRHVMVKAALDQENGQPVARLVMTDITDRVKAQEALAENEAHFRLLTEKASDLICLHQPDGRYEYVSPSARHLIGYSPKELLGQNPYDHFHPDDRKRIQEDSHQPALDGVESITITYRYRHKQGHYIWFETHTQPILDSSGNVKQLFTASRDISLRHQTELALAESRQHMKDVLETVTAVLWSVSLPDFELRYVSPSVAEMFGITSEEFAANPKRWMEAIHPDDQDMLEACLERLYNHETASEQLRLIKPDNSGTRWFATRLSLISNDEGEATQMIGLHTDITEQKLAELALTAATASLEERVVARTADLTQLQQRTEALYLISRTLMSQQDNLPEALLATTEITSATLPADAVLLYILDVEQKQVLGLFQYPPDTTSRLVSFDELWQGLSGWALREFKPAISNNSNDEAREADVVKQRRQEHQSGPIIVVPITAFRQQAIGTLTAIRNTAGKPFTQADAELLQTIGDNLGVAITNSRLTESLRQRTAELSRANRLKDEFLANMSHELRTPLNVILSNVQLMQEQIYGPITPKQVDSLTLVETSAEHLLELITDILDVAKIEAGKFTLSVKEVDIKKVVAASIGLVKEMAHKKQIQLRSITDLNVSTMVADELRLKQILVNLLNNAVKFTPDGGEVTLRIAQPPDTNQVIFTITDTGIGVEQSQIDAIFEPFVQVDAGLSRQQEGTGLGLALVRRLTEIHGGEVAVESTPGQGSRFTISLPRHPANGPDSARYVAPKPEEPMPPDQTRPATTTKPF